MPSPNVTEPNCMNFSCSLPRAMHYKNTRHTIHSSPSSRGKSLRYFPSLNLVALYQPQKTLARFLQSSTLKIWDSGTLDACSTPLSLRDKSQNCELLTSELCQLLCQLPQFLFFVLSCPHTSKLYVLLTQRYYYFPLKTLNFF